MNWIGNLKNLPHKNVPVTHDLLLQFRSLQINLELVIHWCLSLLFLQSPIILWALFVVVWVSLVPPHHETFVSIPALQVKHRPVPIRSHLIFTLMRLAINQVEWKQSSPLKKFFRRITGFFFFHFHANFFFLFFEWFCFCFLGLLQQTFFASCIQLKKIVMARGSYPSWGA